MASLNRRWLGCMLMLPDAGLLRLDRTRAVLESGHMSMVESSNPEAAARHHRSQEHAGPAHWAGATIVFGGRCRVFIVTTAVA